MSSVVLGLENNPIFPTYPRVKSMNLGIKEIWVLIISSACPPQKSVMD